MGYARAFSRASVGMEAPEVRVEVHVDGGLDAFGLVGLPETAVREARDRVRAAVKTSGYYFPHGRVIASLAPADLPKTGGRFDLPIALAILAASRQLDPDDLDGVECIGELSLSGALRPIRGVLTAALAATGAGRSMIVPDANATEAALPRGARIHGARCLTDVTRHLSGAQRLPETAGRGDPSPRPPSGRLADIRGHAGPKRALVVAASGSHNLLMSGPPGTGKTLLARCLPGLLPELEREEALEVAALQSLAGRLDPSGLPGRPFRAPHHSATTAALVGGSSPPAPGEISLAHQGVLFLDELPEFGRHVLESLREPLEGGEIIIARARGSARFPARFQLVAAMNPCPAGHDCRGGGECVCPPDAARRYRARLSGPLLDRIDLHVNVPRLPSELLATPADPSADDQDEEARALVAAARRRAVQRQRVPNAHLDAASTDRLCRPDADGLALLEQASERLGLSARSWHRCLRTARTLADLADSPGVTREHVAEALSYREQPREPDSA
ncbi:MAG: YifB family Mg chelatase-like AAA ATPase [Gammaproteobacteria bacterium]|nr:YifB family Mg chelatase-like AAA ATPase [Gammaproteobacteria bacterium]